MLEAGEGGRKADELVVGGPEAAEPNEVVDAARELPEAVRGDVQRGKDRAV